MYGWLGPKLSWGMSLLSRYDLMEVPMARLNSNRMSASRKRNDKAGQSCFVLYCEQYNSTSNSEFLLSGYHLSGGIRLMSSAFLNLRSTHDQSTLAKTTFAGHFDPIRRSMMSFDNSSGSLLRS